MFAFPTGHKNTACLFKTQRKHHLVFQSETFLKDVTSVAETKPLQSITVYLAHTPKHLLSQFWCALFVIFSVRALLCFHSILTAYEAKLIWWGQENRGNHRGPELAPDKGRQAPTPSIDTYLLSAFMPLSLSHTHNPRNKLPGSETTLSHTYSNSDSHNCGQTSRQKKKEKKKRNNKKKTGPIA